ncbi:hypothetical protein PF010_g28878 [Phytophthora fragariae]|uniref:Uncharacterized protein n=4 Tax=Phytophthora TaxID=4783 RepID=A0A6G0JPU6_9STRA|nr:hypothetical protein PF010_g28878 [Phytophthora fragariae]
MLVSSTRSRWSSRRSSLSSSTGSLSSSAWPSVCAVPQLGQLLGALAPAAGASAGGQLNTFSTMCARSSSISVTTAFKRHARRSRRRPSIVPICLLEKATHLSALRACLEFSAGSSETESCSGGAKGDPHWGSWGCAYFDQASACAEMDLLEEIDAVLALEHEAGLRRRWRDDGEVLAMMPELAGK